MTNQVINIDQPYQVHNNTSHPSSQIHILRISYNPLILPQRNRPSRKDHDSLNIIIFFPASPSSHIPQDIHPCTHAQFLGRDALKQGVDIHCYDTIVSSCLAGVVVLEDEMACNDIVGSYT